MCLNVYFTRGSLPHFFSLRTYVHIQYNYLIVFPVKSRRVLHQVSEGKCLSESYEQILRLRTRGGVCVTQSLLGPSTKRVSEGPTKNLCPTNND